nr:hypothetical protein [Tanacetum cinerariifolium]
MHTVQDDSILGSLRFVSKTKEYQVYGALIPAGMTNRKMLNSTAYKTYLVFATGATNPKKARNKTLVVVEEPAKKPAKKHAARRQSAGVQIRDTPGVSVSKKKAPAKTKRSKRIEFDDDNDDDDDEQNVSNNLRTSDDEEETQEDEFMHTPKNYVPNDDENVDDEEYERINKEMYDDVNAELKDVETADDITTSNFHQ